MVRVYVRTGKIRAIRVGIKLWKYYEADVETFRRQLSSRNEVG